MATPSYQIELRNIQQEEPSTLIFPNQWDLQLRSKYGFLTPKISAVLPLLEKILVLQRRPTQKVITDQNTGNNWPGVPSARRCLCNLLPIPMNQETSWNRGWKDFKRKRTRMSAVRLCLSLSPPLSQYSLSCLHPIPDHTFLPFLVCHKFQAWAWLSNLLSSTSCIVPDSSCTFKNENKIHLKLSFLL